MRQLDKVQGDVMEALRGCKLQPYEAMSIMLNIAMSIARETEPKPIKAVIDMLMEIPLFWSLFADGKSARKVLKQPLQDGDRI